MYKFIGVVKFNDQYFEDGDEVVVTQQDDSVIIGSILIRDREGNETTNWTLYLDVSEKYHKNIKSVRGENIKNIQKVNQ